MSQEDVTVVVGGLPLRGVLFLPSSPQGVVLFAHGSGSSRLSPRNQKVARSLVGAGYGALLFDLLTEDEELLDARRGHLRFDIRLLAQRLAGASTWLDRERRLADLPLGYFGASTGAAAALVAAASTPSRVRAVVSRGGRPDLAGSALSRVQAPTLLLVGALDHVVLRWNQDALEQLPKSSRLVVVPGASHLFEEPGKLDEVANHASRWFQSYLRSRAGEAHA